MLAFHVILNFVDYQSIINNFSKWRLLFRNTFTGHQFKTIDKRLWTNFIDHFPPCRKVMRDWDLQIGLWPISTLKKSVIGKYITSRMWMSKELESVMSFHSSLSIIDGWMLSCYESQGHQNPCVKRVCPNIDN